MAHPPSLVHEKEADLTSNQTLSNLNKGTPTLPNCQQEMPTEGLPGTLYGPSRPVGQLSSLSGSCPGFQTKGGGFQVNRG